MATDNHDDNKPKRNPLRDLQPGHKLITRRDFLAHGLLGMSATLFVPSFFKNGVAFAAGPEIPSSIPFLVFDCAGGAALPGNFLVGRESTGTKEIEQLKSYSRLGWDPRESGALDSSMGLPMSVKYSKILEGLKATASEAARKNLRLGSLCHMSQDDSGINKTSAIGLVVKSGYRGVHIPAGLGRNASDSGGNTGAVATDPLLKPIPVNAVTDVVESLSFGPGFRGLPPEALLAMGNGSKKLSAQQAQRLADRRQGSQLGTLAGTAYENNLKYAAGVEGIDPRSDATFQGVYGISTGTGANDENAISASIVMNVLKNNTGPGVLTIPDCDYHNRGLAATDARDLQIGQQIGRAVEAAHRSKKPLFFQLLTDGGCYSKEGVRDWDGDGGDKSMTVLGYYDPKGAPKQQRLQVGQYTDEQGADNKTLLGGDDPEKASVRASYAVFANYLNLTGRLKDFEKYAPRDLFDAKQLDSLMIFG